MQVVFQIDVNGTPKIIWTVCPSQLSTHRFLQHQVLELIADNEALGELMMDFPRHCHEHNLFSDPTFCLYLEDEASGEKTDFGPIYEIASYVPYALICITMEDFSILADSEAPNNSGFTEEEQAFFSKFREESQNGNN